VKPNRENIVLKNEYFERINTPAFQKLMEIKVFDDPVPRYWLSKALNMIMSEAKEYFKLRREIAEECAKKYDEDGETKKDGKVIKKWKKGDVISLPDGGVEIENRKDFNEKLEKLQAIEVEINCPKVPFTEWLNLTLELETLVLPLMDDSVLPPEPEPKEIKKDDDKR